MEVHSPSHELMHPRRCQALHHGKPCGRPARSYRVTQDGTFDVCLFHAASLDFKVASQQAGAGRPPLWRQVRSLLHRVLRRA